MPAGGAQAMAPFFARLAALSPSQKALAVHFGHFPSDGRAAAYAQRDVGADPGAIALAQGGVPAAAPAARYQPLPPVSSDPRRRPGASETRPARASGNRRAATTSLDLARPVLPRYSRSAPARSRPEAAERAPVEVAMAEPRAAPPPPVAPPPASPPPHPQTPPIFQTVTQAPSSAEPQLDEPAAVGSEPGTATSGPAAIQPAQSAAVPARPVLADPAPAPAPAQAETASAGFTLLQQGAQPRVDSPFGLPTPPPVASPSTVPAGALAQNVRPGSASPFGPPTPPRPSVSAPASATGFESVAALVASLPAEEAGAAPSRPVAAPARLPVRAPVRTAERQLPPVRPERTASRADSRTAARGEETRSGSRSGRARQPTNPSRHWVQIAGGADVRALPREFNRLKTMAPTLLGSRPAWSTPLNATNRLLVGPFDSSAQAQAFVNQLVARHIAAFAWTSPAGQEIERLTIR
jgi:hypothetical protein